MKKTFFFACIFLAACSGQVPQVTVTSLSSIETPLVEPVETPTPTPTLHPQFIALQEQIAASGERFTLLPDGTVQDGATTIPGVQVGTDGKITLTVDSEQVEIDTSLMKFDDENGLSIEGLQDDDGDGNWEVANGLSPEIQAIVDGWNGHISINAENQFLNKDGQVIEGLVYNPESGMAEITRSDAVGHDFTEQFDPALIEVSKDSAGAVDETINYVFSLDENGQLERLKYGETSEYLYTQNEILKMIAENHSTAPGADLDTVPYLKELMSNFWVKNPAGTTWYIKHGDFYEEVGSPGSTLFGTNKVKTWNSEAQKDEVIHTSEYAGVGFGGKSLGDPSYVVIVWEDANDNPIIRIARGSKNINNGSGWWGVTG